MARKSIFGRSRWKHFKEHISILISEALLILRDKTDLPEDEKLLNRKLHSCFAEANYKLGLDYMPAFDAKNSPDPDDKQKAKREDNIPDLSWNIINHADNPEHCNRNFALECKRLGQPTSRSWILNEQYVKEGILRFLLDEEGYGKGCESGAMVGYAQATLNTDYNNLQSAQLQLQAAQNNLAAATMTAPVNAIVATINGIVGQTVGSSGGSTTSSFMVLLNTSGFTITASVNEADVANVQVNQPVRFTVTAYASQTFRATVSSVGVVGTTSSGVVSYPVTMTINMSSVGTAHLYPGMTATASITTASRLGVQLVSNSAFTFTTTALQVGVISRSAITQSFGSTAQQGTSSGQSTGSRHVVLVLRNGQLVPVLITTGLTNGSVSEVLSGLNSGDQVVVGATGGTFANLSTGTTTGGGSLRTGGNFGGGNFGGSTRTGSGG